MLTYSPKSGHIKRDRKVIGRIDPAPGGFEARLFTYPPRTIRERDLPALLAAVKVDLEKDKTQ